jgi:hypothetical protein
MRRRWGIWLLVLAAVPLAVWCFDRVQLIYWVGGTDLEVEFVVTDAATGEPVEAAEIGILSEGGFYRERDEKQFALRTDREGVARRVCHDGMCFGTQSGLRFTDTYHVHLPWWFFRVSAPGYEGMEPVYLDEPEYVRQVRRVGPRAAKVVVKVRIRKLGALARPSCRSGSLAGVGLTPRSG